MEIRYNLTAEQTQKLSMTPEMIQGIQILQLSKQELEEYIKEQVLENPLLEAKESMDTFEYLKENKKDIDIEKTYNKMAYDNSFDDDIGYEELIEDKCNLVDHLMQQLHLCNIDKKSFEIAQYIIEAVEPSGYVDIDIQELAKIYGVSHKEALDILQIVQGFEPTGVAARSLSECLLIQLRAKDMLDEDTMFIVQNCLYDVASNRVFMLSKKLGLKVSVVANIFENIRSLNPKPGISFNQRCDVEYIVPDLFVEEKDQEFYIRENTKAIPRLSISSYYHNLNQENCDEELKEYLDAKIKSALWLIKSINQRKNTIYNVGNAILKRQHEFFIHGKNALIPLTLHDIAEDLGMHESTVSRAINGKYLHCSKGVFELKYFFSRKLQGEEQSFASSSIKSMMYDFIQSEPPQKPYSDQQLCKLFEDKGVCISRRTIAKYREELHIPSSSKRRRL